MTHQHSIYVSTAFALTIGEWRNGFTVFQYKVIVAKALSTCVLNKKPYVEIQGYLITSRKVYIVLLINPEELHHFLHEFNTIVAAEIYANLQTSTLRHETVPLPDLAHHKREHLFHKTEFTNFYLKQILCNQKIHLPYYNPYLQKVIDWAYQHDFCSCIDYTGAIGPVVLKPKKPHVK